MRAMDYRLTDSWSDPPGVTDPFHTERLARLDPLFYCYQPAVEAPAVTPLPAVERGSITFGSFNFFAKVTPQVLATWARLLGEVAGSRLLLLVPKSAELQVRVRGMFAAQGVDPGRLEFAPRAAYSEYLRTIQRVDIALDAFPFNGHTTACDCFWLGVPVVMLAGENYVSRFGTGALAQLGMQDWMARSPEEYGQIAARQASAVPALAKLRADLRARMTASAILDSGAFARRVEAAYRAMWHALLASPRGEAR
jgi:predicted O-linked N-acetylglucosamine transferase (SPINDLY family)